MVYWLVRGVMTEHLSKSSLERFPERTASTEKLVREVRHIEQCAECRQRWREVVRFRRGREPDGLPDIGQRCSPVPPVSDLVSDLVSIQEVVADRASEQTSDPPAAWGWLAAEHLTPAEVVEWAGRLLPVLTEVAAVVGSGRSGANNITEIPGGKAGSLPEVTAETEDLYEMFGLHLRFCAACRDAVRNQRSGATPGRRGRAAIQAAMRTAMQADVFPALLLGLLVTVVGLCLVLFSDPRVRHRLSIWRQDSSPAAGHTEERVRAGEADGPERSDSPRLVLLDGGRRIVLMASGALAGLDELNPADRQMIAQTLLVGELPDPGVTDLVIEEPPRLRSSIPAETEPRPAVRLLAPPASVITSNTPVFRWASERSVINWIVELAEVGGGQRLRSPVLTASAKKWQPVESLRRGTTWQAILRGRTRGEEMVSTPRKFRILGARELVWLEELRRTTQSHLARGLAYARLGLISEAISELELLDAENPDNLLVKRFLLRLMAENAP
jgi:hypothetical protein